MISKSLEELYKKSHKNYDYALSTLLSSFDSKTYLAAFMAVNEFDIGKREVNITISESTYSQIKTLFPNKWQDEAFIELLLWIAVIFPKI